MTEQPKNEGAVEVNESKLQKILDKAIKDHTFGRSLSELTTEEKQALKPMLNEAFDKEASLVSPTFIRNEEANVDYLKLETRKGLRMLLGAESMYNGLPSPVKYINSLQKELLIALGEYEGEVQYREGAEGYEENFYTYLMTLPDKELGIVDVKSLRHVRVFDEQVPPSEITDGLIIISYLLPFADNLAFIKQHISQAIQLDNLHRS